MVQELPVGGDTLDSGTSERRVMVYVLPARGVTKGLFQEG